MNIKNNVQKKNKINYPTVFIVLPVYNREKFIERCVQSILDQTYQHWILMIVDDNSTDESAEIINNLSEIDERIKWKKNEEFSHSAAGARKSGLLDIKGEYIAFLDSDDEWPNYHLEEFVNFLEKERKIDVVFGDLKRCKSDGTIVSYSKFDNENGLPMQLISEWNGGYALLSNKDKMGILFETRFTVGFHSSLYRRIVFDKLKIREVDTGEDFLFTLEMVNANFKLAASKRIHLHYTIHNDNVSGCNYANNYSKILEIALNELYIYKKLIPMYINLSKQEKGILKKCIANIYVWNIANNAYRKAGLRLMAMLNIFRGLLIRPLDLKYWKTLFGTIIRR